MTGVRQAVEAMCWITAGCSEVASRVYKTTRNPATWDLALLPASSCFVRNAYASASPPEGVLAESEIDEGCPRYLVDIPATEELRLLVSDLRQREAVRHRMRREGKRHGGDLLVERSLDGLLPVFKPSGITSTDVCRLVRHLLRSAEALPSLESLDGTETNTDAVQAPQTAARLLHKEGASAQRRKLRVGHGGTLDPAASGVLVLGIGRGTEALQSLLNGPKEYVARVRLGSETDTLDADGRETRQASWEHVTHAKLAEAIASFKGRYFQQAPLFSAKRVRGRQLYTLMREGLQVTPEKRPAACLVTIERIKLHCHEGVKLPDFDVSVRCSKGTYIRQLAADISAAVGSVAHLRLLVRTRQGPFTVEDCIALDGASRETLLQHLVPLEA